MSIKSVLVSSVLVVLDFYIGLLVFFAHCLNFMLCCLEDASPVNQENLVPMVEKTDGCDDQLTHETEPDTAGTASETTTPVDRIVPAEVQSRPPSPSPLLPFIQISQDKAATAPSTSPLTTPGIPLTPIASAQHPRPRRDPPHQPLDMDSNMLASLAALQDAANGQGTNLLRLLNEADIPLDSFGSDEGEYGDQLRSVVPCWDRDDVVGEGSTCPVVIHPELNCSLDTLQLIHSRAQELFSRFGFAKDTSLLLRAGHVIDHAIAISHPIEGILGGFVWTRALIRCELFKATEDVAFLDQSIDDFQAGLSLISRDITPCHEMLYTGGKLLAERHDKKGRREDLDQAIEALGEALELWPPDENPPLELINDLGATLVKRWEIGGTMSDAENAIRHLEGLLSDMHSNHPSRPAVLGNLGAVFLTMCKRTGNVADVDRAIRHLEDAVSLLPNDSRHRFRVLHNLGNAFHIRYDTSGRASDLDGGIRLYQRALSLRQSSHETLNNLSNALWTRFKRNRDATDLDQAILHVEKAISLIENEDPRRADCLGNFANVLYERYGISDDATDLNKAIELHEQTLLLRPGSHPDRSVSLHNLCSALVLRKRLSGNASDLQRGLGCLVESLSLIPSGHPRRQDALFNLLFFQSILAPWDSFSTDHLTGVLDQCAGLAKLTPRQHPDYSNAMSLIVPVLLTCHKKQLDIHRLCLATGLGLDFTAEDAALALLDSGSKASASPANFRLKAACDWIGLCQELNRPCTLDMFTRIFDLLDLSIARGCSLETRHKHVSTDILIVPAKRLVPEAVAFAIEQGAIETAIEFHERGQSILLAQLSRYRSSSFLDALHSVRPDLATRFCDLSWQVEHATFTEGQPLPGSASISADPDRFSRSNRLKTDWEDVVQQIHTLDGFHDFLRPTPFPILKQAAAGGPIILINISKSRSDAIVVTFDQPPIVIPLPFATPGKVDPLVSAFTAAPQNMSNVHAQSGLHAVWDIIVEPVVTELQETLHLPKNSRIWWCPTGAVACLPLHAAGNYRRSSECLPSLYVSSYTSSLVTLIRSRGHTSSYSGLPGVLLVGQPETPGQQELPAVQEEINRIKKHFPDATEIMGEHATHDSVLSAVGRHQWIHFACHGHVKSEDPLHSHFSLHDGPLTLLKLMQQRLPSAEFAFLSACHSASSNSDTPDEFLHLVAGMQFAGFKSVVGTLWAMNDSVGPILADEVYRRMQVGKGNVDYTRAARALNGSVKKLWKDKVPLSLWINFVHWGA